MKALDYIVACKFFPKYAKSVKNWRHKMRGKSGRGEKLDFTPEDKKVINAGIRRFIIDITPRANA